MSLWLYKKDKDGKPYVIAVDVMPSILPVMLLIGLIAAFFLPMGLATINPASMIRFFLWAGFLCLLAAKLSLFRSGVWFSWGSRQMTRRWSRVYKMGYILMSIGTVMTIAAYRATH